MYWRDFWADTGHLSPVEGWAYLNLIGAYWTNGGPLQNDDARLARQAKVSASEWRKVRAVVIAFFAVDDKAIHHKRINEELATATARHAAKVKAGTNGAKKRWQNDSTAIAEPSVSHKQTDAQLQPHSPNGEAEANASVATKPRKARRTRLADDWKPSEDDHAHAVSEGLTDAEIAADLAEWREYWRGPEPRDPLKANWSATYRKHVTKWAPGIIAGRARSQRPAGNSRRDQSVTAATDSILAKAGLRRAGGAGPVSTHDLSDGVGNQSGADDSGAVVDAVEWRRVSESSEGIEGSDTPDPGDDGRSGIAACGVPEAADGLPGRRGAACPDDTSEIQPVVACVAGSSREIGTAYLSAPQDAGGAEGYADIPAFLDRRHEFDRSGH
jgi:uncharacterized protein YdaU (DUF1376 family)